MHKYNTTDWFDASVNPSRPGVYECSFNNIVWCRYFDGKYWYFGGRSPAYAFEEYNKYPIIVKQLTDWRGVTNDWIDASIHPEFEGEYQIYTPHNINNKLSMFINNQWGSCYDESLHIKEYDKIPSEYMKRIGSMYKLYKEECYEAP